MPDTEPLFTGVAVALVTLFDERGEVDVTATVAHAERLIDLGVRAVLVAGSTGEAPALSADERVALVAALRDRLPPDVPLLAGTGAASARQAVRLSRQAADAGADAVLVLSPPRASDPRAYYATVCDAVDVPVLAYHLPLVSPPGVPVDVLPELGVAGIKDSSGQPGRLLRERSTFDGWLYTGAADLLVQAGAIGCDGAILALANVDPTGCIAAFAGDGKAQLALVDDHVASHADFPHGLKRRLADRYRTSTTARMG